MKPTTPRLRIWVCGGIMVEAKGLTNHISPRTYITVARSEGEAFGSFVQWIRDNWPHHALHSVAAYPVPDEFVGGAFNEMEGAALVAERDAARAERNDALAQRDALALALEAAGHELRALRHALGLHPAILLRGCDGEHPALRDAQR